MLGFILQCSGMTRPSCGLGGDLSWTRISMCGKMEPAPTSLISIAYRNSAGVVMNFAPSVCTSAYKGVVPIRTIGPISTC